MKKLLLIFLAVFFASSCYATEYLDTQYGPNGLEVHLLKINTVNKALTIAFAVENSSDKSVTFVPMDVREVFYTTKEKKYPVLQDANGKWLAAPMTGMSLFREEDGSLLPAHTIRKGAKEVGWVKFEAPAESDWPVEVTLPGVSPFLIENPAANAHE